MNTADIERLIHRISVGEHAKALQSSLPAGRSALVVLPSVAWVRALDGFPQRKQVLNMMPVSVEWSCGLVALMSESGFVTGRSRDSTRNLSFKVDVHVGGFGSSAVIETSPESVIPSRIDAAMMTRQRVGSELGEMVRSAQQARWELWSWVTSKSWIRETVERAVRQVSAEMRSPGEALDRYDIDAVIAHVELDHNTTMRTIDRYTKVGSVRPGVDFMRALKVAFKRDALDEIRRRVDDPAVGPAVRRFICSFEGESVRDALDGFNVRRAASARVSYERFARSLDPCAAPRLVSTLDDRDAVSAIADGPIGMSALDGSFHEFVAALVVDEQRLKVAARRVLAEDLRTQDAAVLRAMEVSRSTLESLAGSTADAPARRSLRAVQRRAAAMLSGTSSGARAGAG